jgi:uroporphyrin-III C-methyltransferase
MENHQSLHAKYVVCHVSIRDSRTILVDFGISPAISVPRIAERFLSYRHCTRCSPGAGSTVMDCVVPGTVYLVGAGPGAPDLITVRGLRILSQADVVLHDALISPELLANVRSDAQVVSVGKRGYCVGSTRQETIHTDLERYARAGNSVCRLKCGDPNIFGRGGEEAQHLAALRIPFECVPGVTSALGVCAAASIPLTHRDVGQSVAFVTGHNDPDSPDCTHDWDALSRIPVVVFYMAVRHIGRIAERLCEAGVSAEMPCAVIESGTLPDEHIIVSNLAAIGDELSQFTVAGPAIFIVGEVVRYREELTNETNFGLPRGIASRAGVLT